MSNEIVPYHQQWCAQVPRSTRASTLSGYAVLLIGVGGFLAWAAFAPIDGAVITPGNFVTTGQNKIVQHLEGGIIREILVKEGEMVEAGQPLFRLEESGPRADLTRLLLRLVHLEATAARLRAEMAGANSISFPMLDFEESEVPGFESVLHSQRQIFEANRNKLESDIAIQERGAAALAQEIKGNEQRVGSIQQQISLLKEELGGKAKLFAAGLVRKPEYYATQRSKLNLEGELSRLRSETGEARERLAAAEKTTVRSRQLAVQKAAEDLQTASSELKDVRERVAGAKAVLSRLEVKAPIRGIVAKMNYHTTGGVIRPGNDILAIVPSGGELIIEVNVRPQDINHVKTGQEALVKLTALNQRLTPMVPASVVFVSPDALPNERKFNADNIYVARVQLDRDKAGELQDFHPTPGMPAEVYIKTGRRTFFEYLARPVLDTMSRAFRES